MICALDMRDLKFEERMMNLYAVRCCWRERGKNTVRASWWKRGRVRSHVSCRLVPLTTSIRAQTRQSRKARSASNPASPPSFERSSPSPTRNHNVSAISNIEALSAARPSPTSVAKSRRFELRSAIAKMEGDPSQKVHPDLVRRCAPGPEALALLRPESTKRLLTRLWR